MTNAEKKAPYDATKPFNKIIRDKIEQTWTAADLWGVKINWEGKRPVVKRPQHFSLEEMDSTDGIGTKGKLHWMNKTYEYAAQDAFAMVVNDLIEHGFTTYKIVDTIAINSEDRQAILGIVDGLVALSKRHGVIISGGETAVKSNLDGLDIDITATGVRSRSFRPPTGLKKDSILIGLRSSGFHSNGFSVINKVYSDMLRNDKPDRELLDKLTLPTSIYTKELTELYQHNGYGNMIHGMVHITGGGWTKLSELDPTRTMRIHVCAPAPSNTVFDELYAYSQYSEMTLSPRSMYTYFNCGIGFVVAVDKKLKDKAIDILRIHNPVDMLATITQSNFPAVNVIDSTFSNVPLTDIRL